MRMPGGRSKHLLAMGKKSQGAWSKGTAEHKVKGGMSFHSWLINLRRFRDMQRNMTVEHRTNVTHGWYLAKDALGQSRKCLWRICSAADVVVKVPNWCTSDEGSGTSSGAKAATTAKVERRPLNNRQMSRSMMKETH